MASKLTDAEVKALDEADSILERAFNEAAGKVRGIRRRDDVPPDGFLSCKRCDCESFVSPTSGSDHLTCKRPSCRHSFFSHDVF
jgi:hypothetical protein